MPNNHVGSPLSATEPCDLVQLLDQLRSHSLEDAGPLLERFRPYLMAIAIGELPEQLKGKMGPSDLVQETMLRAVRGIRDFRGMSREELAGWLRQILLNHMTNMAHAFATSKRDAAREVAIDSRVADRRQPSPSSETLSREEWELLRGALERLPEDYRKAVLLRHRSDLTFMEIARLLNRSEEAARKLWCRAIQQLQRELSGHESRTRA